MRHKIVALTATALKVGLCTHPATAEAVAGMETALIALNGVLGKLTYFNATHKVWELTRQFEKEADTHAAQSTEQARYIQKAQAALRERTEQFSKASRLVDRQNIELRLLQQQVETLQVKLLQAGTACIRPCAKQR